MPGSGPILRTRCTGPLPSSPPLSTETRRPGSCLGASVVRRCVPAAEACLALASTGPAHPARGERRWLVASPPPSTARSGRTGSPAPRSPDRFTAPATRGAGGGKQDEHPSPSVVRESHAHRHPRPAETDARRPLSLRAGFAAGAIDQSLLELDEACPVPNLVQLRAGRLEILEPELLHTDVVVGRQTAIRPRAGTDDIDPHPSQFR